MTSSPDRDRTLVVGRVGAVSGDAGGSCSWLDMDLYSCLYTVFIFCILYIKNILCVTLTSAFIQRSLLSTSHSEQLSHVTRVERHASHSQPTYLALAAWEEVSGCVAHTFILLRLLLTSQTEYAQSRTRAGDRLTGLLQSTAVGRLLPLLCAAPPTAARLRTARGRPAAG